MTNSPKQISGCDDLRQRLATTVAGASACTLRWTAADDGRGDSRSCRARPMRVDRDEFVAAVPALIAAELAAAQVRGRRVMVTFRDGGADLFFVARIARLDESAVAFDLPDHLLESSRRTGLRVEVAAADGDLVSAKAWRIDDRMPLRDRPLASREMTCTVRDLCAAGGRFVLAPKHRTAGAPPHVGDRLRIGLTCGEHAMLFDGRIRAIHAITPDGPWLCGAEFAVSRHDVESKRDFERLHKTIAELQRRAIRQAAA